MNEKEKSDGYKKITDKIIEIINSSVKKIEIRPDQTNEDLTKIGVDSIEFIKIIVDIEETFDIEIPDDFIVMPMINTVSKISDIVVKSLDNEKRTEVKTVLE